MDLALLVVLCILCIWHDRSLLLTIDSDCAFTLNMQIMFPTQVTKTPLCETIAVVES